jgi:hypothetical protein
MHWWNRLSIFCLSNIGNKSMGGRQQPTHSSKSIATCYKQ